MDMNGPRQRQQDVDVQQRNSSALGLQEIAAAARVLGIERRLHVFKAKLHLQIANRKDAESVSLTQRNGGEGAFARQRRQCLSHRYTAGIRKGFRQILNIWLNVECRAHRDSTMTYDNAHRMPHRSKIGLVPNITLEITSQGNTIDDTIEILSMTVNSAINRIPSAEIVVADGDPANSAFPVTDGDTFKLGTEIAIHAGYDGASQPVFKGIVVRQGIRIASDNSLSRLVVECRDNAIAMTIGLKSAKYVDRTDSQVIRSLIGNYSGLSSDVSDSAATIPELVQHQCTDWDFLLSRAEVNGFVVVVDQNNVIVKAPVTSGSADLKLSRGESLLELQADLSVVSNPRGRVKFQGNAKVKPGQLIELEGVGARFSGKVYVSAVKHTVAEGTWNTEAAFGIPPDRLA